MATGRGRRRRPARPSPTRTGRRCARTRRRRRARPPSPWRRPSPAARARRRARSARYVGELGRAGARHEEPDRAVGRRRERRRRVAVDEHAALRGQRDRGDASGMPSTTSATCTAQSVRPASPHSRVPSSGSTIHTRSRVEPRRVVLRLLGEDRVVGSVLAQERRGSGRCLAVAFARRCRPRARSSQQEARRRGARPRRRARDRPSCVGLRLRPVRGSSSCFAARRSTPASTGFTSIDVDVGAAARGTRRPRGRAAAGSSRGGSRPPDSSSRRSIATATPPMLPICMSRTTRSGSSRRTASRTSWPRVTSTTRWSGPTNAARTWSRTHCASAATRIVVLIAGQPSSCAGRDPPMSSLADLVQRGEVVDVAREVRARTRRSRRAERVRAARRGARARARDLAEVGEVVVARGRAARAAGSAVVLGAQRVGARRAARRAPRRRTRDARGSRSARRPPGRGRASRSAKNSRLFHRVAPRRRDEHERGRRVGEQLLDRERARRGSPSSMPSNARKNATTSSITSEPTTRATVRRNVCTATLATLQVRARRHHQQPEDAVVEQARAAGAARRGSRARGASAACRRR